MNAAPAFSLCRIQRGRFHLIYLWSSQCCL